ncbi:RICIN domain-containing protein [Actinomadura sp. DC4]|uniref:RICIN domain-containing protein n=1 Tax=Actinomadura sp. DC4 TaxID=3055069 RepID=UPI0025B0DF0C|nr:RICIN domain-containing protein [Actinomadura sp. DC4]MDN3351595.1 RICIN domain-containing protein [Actinomadura sp. DC4]
MNAAKKLVKTLALVFSALVTAALLTTPAAHAATPFKVLAFYTGPAEGDAAHVSFETEARTWFPKVGAQNGFTFTATTNWDQLNSLTASQYQVVMFLDDAPHTSAERTGFQNYMNNGGAFFGFHVSAFTTNGADWDWYYNQFLGTGAFETNTWGPSAAILDNGDPSHPAMRRVPAKFTSGVSEWYSWQHDLRQNPNIDVLASVDPASFPLGTNASQSWTSGYYPIMWSNKKYKMLYANFGHNDMNYSADIATSSTFADPAQDAFILDGLLSLAGAPATDQSTDPVSQSQWYTLVNAGNGKCVDARAAGTASGTVIQQYACNGTTAQQFQFQYVDGPYTRINNRNAPAEVLDVTGKSTADNAPIQLWTYSSGKNQQWQLVPEASGTTYRIVNRNSAAGQGHMKCLTSPSSADSVQLQQSACNGAAAQSFRLQ